MNIDRFDNAPAAYQGRRRTAMGKDGLYLHRCDFTSDEESQTIERPDCQSLALLSEIQYNPSVAVDDHARGTTR
jgi:hypothetical protein